jgi:DNA-binding MarR family transcriptional regulator
VPAGRPHAQRISTASLEAMADDVLLAPVAAARARMQNPRELSERVAVGKALWRELVIGFAAQLGELRLGFTQLAALYALADGGTTTIADLADTLNRSPSATSRLVDGLVRRRLLERREEPDDRRMRSVWLTERGRALVALVDRGRADQFLAVVRPLPAAERAIVAMGVAALASRAVSRRGRLIKQPPPERLAGVRRPSRRPR